MCTSIVVEDALLQDYYDYVEDAQLQEQTLYEYVKPEQLEKLPPLVYVPGLASTTLQVHEDAANGPLPPQCSFLKNKGWDPLYMNVGMLLTAPSCLTHAMKLVYGNGAGEGPPITCGQNSQGVEVKHETAKSAGYGVNRVGGKVVAETMLQYLGDLGYVMNDTLAIAGYDWRKAGLPCFEEEYAKLLTDKVEALFAASKAQRVSIASHSMGCPVIHRFLASKAQAWKDKYINTFFSIAGPHAGSPLIMQFYLVGPRELLGNIKFPGGYDKELRAMLTSWSGFMSLVPNGLADVWENRTFIQVGEKKYGIAEIVDGSYFKDRQAYDANETHKKGKDAENPPPTKTAALEQNLTEKGCKCRTDCKWDGGFSPTCYTVTEEKCGRTSLIHGLWDYCFLPGTRHNPSGDPALTEFITEFVKKYPSIGPPNVNTVGFTVDNKQTRVSWKFDSYQDSLQSNGVDGKTMVGSIGGDGTVPASSSHGPCLSWKKAAEGSKIKVDCQKVSMGKDEGIKSTYHSSMLSDPDLQKWFREELVKIA